MNCNDCGGVLPRGCECSPFGGRSRDNHPDAYSRERIANLMSQFKCSRETAVRVIELRQEGYPLREASIMAGAADPAEERA